MARISGRVLPNDKQVETALTYYLWSWSNDQSVNFETGRNIA